MTNNEIIKIAMQQSAVDSNCCFEDFMKYSSLLLLCMV